MRTNIDINDELLEEAKRLTNINVKKGLIHEALRILIAVLGRKSFLEIRNQSLIANDYNHKNTRIGK